MVKKYNLFKKLSLAQHSLAKIMVSIEITQQISLFKKKL